jgi:hypothetical protein
MTSSGLPNGPTLVDDGDTPDFKSSLLKLLCKTKDMLNKSIDRSIVRSFGLFMNLQLNE